MKAAHLESSPNQDIGTEMKATQIEVKKEECEGVEGVLSTGKVEQGKLIPFCIINRKRKLQENIRHCLLSENIF
jgi:hypothetical protein